MELVNTIRFDEPLPPDLSGPKPELVICEEDRLQKNDLVELYGTSITVGRDVFSEAPVMSRFTRLQSYAFRKLWAYSSSPLDGQIISPFPMDGFFFRGGIGGF